MKRSNIRTIIDLALEILYFTEKELILSKSHEQSISARIMLHLQHLLPDWNVDVEYNRQGTNRDPKTDVSGINRKPDIIIHKRGPKGPNLAIILIKCEWNIEPRDNDKEVALSLKKKHNYHHAFLLKILHSNYNLDEVK